MFACMQYRYFCAGTNTYIQPIHTYAYSNRTLSRSTPPQAAHARTTLGHQTTSTHTNVYIHIHTHKHRTLSRSTLPQAAHARTTLGHQTTSTNSAPFRAKKTEVTVTQ